MGHILHGEENHLPHTVGIVVDPVEEAATIVSTVVDTQGLLLPINHLHVIIRLLRALVLERKYRLRLAKRGVAHRKVNSLITQCHLIHVVRVEIEVVMTVLLLELVSSQSKKEVILKRDHHPGLATIAKVQVNRIRKNLLKLKLEEC